MIAPSTQTYTDRIQHIKRLGEEIVALNTERDTLQQAIESTKSVLYDIFKTKTEIETDVQELENNLVSILGIAQTATTNSHESFRIMRDNINELKIEFEMLYIKTVDMKREITLLKGDTEREQHRLVMENEKLESMRNDLDIYRKRLEKKGITVII